MPSRYVAWKIFGALATILLTIWISYSIAFGHTDHDDDASLGEWIFLIVLTAIVVIGLAVLRVVYRRDTNPHTGLPSRAKRRRARGPMRGGRLD
jgi:membrane protein DedA with SNARE-associated domain